MGWEVIAFGQVEVDEKYNEKVKTKLKELDIPESAFTKINYEYLDFEMSGNKGINYEELEALRDWSIKMKIPMNINTSEYSECGSGFYFDSNDHEAEEEKDEKRTGD